MKIMSQDENEFRHINVGTPMERARTAAVLGNDSVDDLELLELRSTRPRTRLDCPEADVPCPFAGCRYHLASDEVRGEARVAPGFILIRGNCALHFVDANPWGATLEDIGEELLLTRERVRQIELAAIKKLRSTGIYIELNEGVAPWDQID